jgi:hypothetical protein
MDGPRPAKSIVASLGLLLVLGLLALATACSSPDEVQGSTVPFIICQSSETWTRPSEEQQARQVWHGPFKFRYDNWAPAALRSTFYEDFFTWSGGNSEMFDKWPLHGLWTAEDLSLGDPACEEGGPRLNRGEVTSVFLLLHEAKEVRLSDNTFYVTVGKGPMGFQEIQFPNLLFPAQATREPSTKDGPVLDYNVAIVDTSGRELARARDGAPFQPAEEAAPSP